MVELLGPVNPPPAVTKFVAENDGPVKPAEVAIAPLALSVVTPDTAPLFSVTPDTLLDDVESVLIDGPVKPAEVAIAPLALSVVTPDTAPLFNVTPPILFEVPDVVMFAPAPRLNVVPLSVNSGYAVRCVESPPVVTS